MSHKTKPGAAAAARGLPGFDLAGRQINRVDSADISDMQAATLLIAEIKIGKRHRRDLGDVAGLAASIRDVGLLHPVVVTREGRLIAGARRIRAHELLERDSIPVTVVDLDKIAHGEHAENTFRKDFTLTEAVAIKRAVEPLLKADAEARMLAGKGADGSGGRGKKRKPVANLAPGKTRDLVAKHTGKARTSLAKAEALVAAAEAEPDNVKIKQLVEAMDKSGRVNGPYRRLTNMRQAEAIRAEPPPLPSRGPYRVAVADVPWPFEVNDDNPAHRGAWPFPTMSIEQICALDVGSIMHNDAILWFWTTNFHLRHAYKILDAWGFHDTPTMLTWAKDRMGNGHWLRGQTEHCIVAVRGKPTVTLTNQTTLLHAPVRAHSEMPAEFYALVERLCPAPRYADLFSRYQHNDKWDCHGDHAPVAGDPAEAAE
jgi:N6-adenosine-specific RNA methylase IME4/ParB-like chromosome segregation protein Spo0J